MQLLLTQNEDTKELKEHAQGISVHAKNTVDMHMSRYLKSLEASG